MLTWWQGTSSRSGFGQGEEVIYNTSYRQIGRIRAGNGYHADLHEFHITPQGTAWIDAFDPIHMNLTSLRRRLRTTSSRTASCRRSTSGRGW